MYQDGRVAVVIVAAGSGTRMGDGISKQYIRIGGEMILEKALVAFSEHACVDEIYLVVKKEDLEFCCEEFIGKRKIAKIRAILSGGKDRQASVFNGLKTIYKSRERCGFKETCGTEPLPRLVLIHDGARPFVSRDVIDGLIEASAKWGAASAGVPVKDTIARAEDVRIMENLERDSLYSIQTPQGFLLPTIYNAHAKAKRDKFVATDDASIVRRIGTDVVLVEGDYRNIKITTKEDIEIARAFVNALHKESKTKTTIGYRVGTGFDVHAFAPKRRLVLGGTHIPFDRGLKGHSDADVLVHSIMDALLGACGLGDIGTHFPDNNPEYKDISSMTLLAAVGRTINEAGFDIGNIDAVVIAEKPKIAPYISNMKNNIAATLKIDRARVNIKGTTTEKLGFCGREEGIAAMATATVLEKNDGADHHIGGSIL